MRIDIVLDVICPWCFIGKRRLEIALARRPEIAPEIQFRPFQLNPEMPDEGMPRQDYLTAKFGGGHHAGRLYQSLAEAGAAIGLDFAFERIRRTPATRDAHRLVRRAQREGRAEPLIDALFRAYFAEGRDLGDRAVLAAVAGAVGMDAAETLRFLATGDGVREFVEDERGARRAGINAVPCFVFEGQYAISGAQEPEFFLPIFDLVETESAKAIAAPAAQTLRGGRTRDIAIVKGPTT